LEQTPRQEGGERIERKEGEWKKKVTKPGRKKGQRREKPSKKTSPPSQREKAVGLQYGEGLKKVESRSIDAP